MSKIINLMSMLLFTAAALAYATAAHSETHAPMTYECMPSADWEAFWSRLPVVFWSVERNNLMLVLENGVTHFYTSHLNSSQQLIICHESTEYAKGEGV